MTGWRIGYAGGREDLIKAMAMLQSQSTSNPVAVSQWASVEALNGPQDFIAKHNAIFKERRDLVRLDAQPGQRPQVPEAGGRVLRLSVLRRRRWARPRRRARSSRPTRISSPSCWRAEGVAVVQGTPFGFGPAFRISYATKTEDLEEACRRIQRFCGNLK